MRRYWKYIKPYLVYFILAPVFMCVEVLGEVKLPEIVSDIINTGIAGKDIAYILQSGGKMVLFAVMMMAGGVCGSFFATKASVSFAADLRRDIFAKVQTFSFKNIDDFSTGSLVTRLTNDITQLQNVLRMSLIMLLRSPGMFVGALIMAYRMNSSLVMVIAAVIPFLVISIILILRTAFPRFDTMQKKLDGLNSRIQENITNMRVIKSFLRNRFEEKKFFASAADLRDATLNAMKIVIMTMPVMTLVMNITMITVMWFGGNFVIEGRMPVGNLTAFTTYIVQILMSLMMLSMIFLQSSRAMASAKRISEVMDTKVDLNDENAARKDLAVTHGKVEFKHVFFKYHEDNQENILEDISFTAEPGQTIGIIGATGCGKTTMVQLIPRLYDVTMGEVLVDGVNVRDYSLAHLRNGVSMVLQKNVLFSGTIEENLRWGDENASMEQMRQAAQAAEADGFIEGFTDGYSTELGQGGVNVSGGQKQRLCIARALLKRPKILILDDSTSALDSATEGRIRQSFATVLKDTTKFIIAQRIQSVVDSDQIIVLKDGAVCGCGTHAELIRDNEEYQAIYYSQMDKEVSA